MNRGGFLRNLAVTTAALQDLVNNANGAEFSKRSSVLDPNTSEEHVGVDTGGYTQVSEFEIGPTAWGSTKTSGPATVPVAEDLIAHHPFAPTPLTG